MEINQKIGFKWDKKRKAVKYKMSIKFENSKVNFKGFLGANVEASISENPDHLLFHMGFKWVIVKKSAEEIVIRSLI